MSLYSAERQGVRYAIIPQIMATKLPVYGETSSFVSVHPTGIVLDKITEGRDDESVIRAAAYEFYRLYGYNDGPLAELYRTLAEHFETQPMLRLIVKIYTLPDGLYADGLVVDWIPGDHLNEGKFILTAKLDWPE